MTLIVSAIAYHDVRQVTDRLVSDRGRQFDPVSNKNVVLFTRDSVVTMAYTGTAFISRTSAAEKVPTDEWIVEVCTGRRIPRGPEGLPVMALGSGVPVNRPLDLGLTLKRLCEALDNAFANGLVAPAQRDQMFVIVIAGWRCGRQRCRPILCYVWREHPRARFQVAWRQRHLGRAWHFSIDPQQNAHLAEVEALRLDMSRAASTEDLERSLVAAVRRTSAALPSYVGPDLMSIHVPPPRAMYVGIKFLPLRDASTEFHGTECPVGFSPWIASPTVLSPPQLVIGGYTLHLGAWRVEITAPEVRGRGLMQPQSRPRP